MPISPQELLKAAPKGKSAAELAEAYGISGKDFRVFLRNEGIRVGRGKTHSLTVGGERENALLRKFFSSRGKEGVTDADLETLRKYVADKDKK